MFVPWRFGVHYWRGHFHLEIDHALDPKWEGPLQTTKVPGSGMAVDASVSACDESLRLSAKSPVVTKTEMTGDAKSVAPANSGTSPLPPSPECVAGIARIHIYITTSESGTWRGCRHRKI